MKTMIEKEYPDQMPNPVHLTFNESVPKGHSDHKTYQKMTELTRLVLKAKAGNQEAEGMLFEKLFVRFLVIAKRRVWEENAEDLAQDACRKVFEKYRTENFTSSFDSWAYKILRNTIGNHIQHEKIKKNILVPQNDWDKTVITVHSGVDEDLRRRLLDSLKKITRINRRYARILVLIYQGYKINEISNRLQISPNNCYVILNRARNMLRRSLDTGYV